MIEGVPLGYWIVIFGNGINVVVEVLVGVCVTVEVGVRVGVWVAVGLGVEDLKGILVRVGVLV